MRCPYLIASILYRKKFKLIEIKSRKLNDTHFENKQVYFKQVQE